MACMFLTMESICKQVNESVRTRGSNISSSLSKLILVIRQSHSHVAELQSIGSREDNDNHTKELELIDHIELLMLCYTFR
jgi:hypothetical protein